VVGVVAQQESVSFRYLLPPGHRSDSILVHCDHTSLCRAARGAGTHSAPFGPSPPIFQTCEHPGQRDGRGVQAD
jgi:hypothetical protein